MSVALVSAATATATAFTVGVEPAPAPAKRVAAEDVDLAAAISLLPTHDKVSDITGGLGSQIYNVNQTILDQLSRAIVGGVSLTALAQAAGVDPQSLVNGLLADLPAGLVPSILDALGNSINLPILSTALGQLSAADQALLSGALGLLGTQLTDGTLKGLLALLGLNLSDPLNLSNLTDKLGINIVTAGSPFSVLKMLGIDLGWVPGLPNSVASDIDNTPYLKIGVNGILNTAIGTLQQALDNGTLSALNLSGLLGALGLPIPLPGVDLTPVVQNLITSLGDVVNQITSGLPDVLDTRITPTIGVGLGAFAAAMAYKQVIADLANQPGGANYPGLSGSPNPLLGSLTILPLILVNNPARPDGGLAARFADVASLLGIDAVNPDTSLTGVGGTGNVLGTGLHVGGANVLPVLIDATYEYQPLSDFASWPDAFTLVNNLAAALSPTYMLRGLGFSDITDQLSHALEGVGLNPVSLNLYLTLHSQTLPLLEPLYLASDAMNIVGLKPIADLALHLANALAPALTTLVNIGYANAVQNPDGTITRNYDTAGTETPFLSFANIDYGKAISDSITQLIGGFQKEFFSGNPTAGGPNILSNLINSLLDGSLLGATTSATTLSTPSTVSASSVPSANARLLTVASAETDTPAATGDTSKDAATSSDSSSGATRTPAADTADQKTSTDKTTAEKTPEKTADGKTTPAATDSTTSADAQTPAADGSDTSGASSDPTPAKGPKHAKPDTDSASSTGDQSTGPKHAKPDTGGGVSGSDATDTGAATTPKHSKPTTNETRDTANDFSPKGGDSADKHDKKARGADAGATASAGGSDAGASGSSSSSDKAA
jgi:hypothetical protein